jgi:hypothetical protein
VKDIVMFRRRRYRRPESHFAIMLSRLPGHLPVVEVQIHAGADKPGHASQFGNTTPVVDRAGILEAAGCSGCLRRRWHRRANDKSLIASGMVGAVPTLPRPSGPTNW